MKKCIRGWLVISLILTMLIPSMTWASTNDAQLDAVLVIDASLSMKSTDPNKLGLEAVKMFVDMLGMTENQVGIVTYARNADATYPMSVVSSQQDKEKIKAFVDTIDRNLNYTDITSGLMAATQMLDQRTITDNAPLIVVFTDGNNDISGLTDRTDADIAADLSTIIQTSKSNKYPIYTVGLNGNGGLNKDYLADISTQTNAKSFVTSDPKELPAILTEIFADHLNLKVQSLKPLTGTDAFEEVIINIPNGNVLEANISATSTKDIALKIVDPQGVEQAIPSQNITLHTSNTYNILKLSRPMQGDWKLYVKGVQGDAINIDLVYNYQIGVTMKPLTQKGYSIGDSLGVEAFLSVNGNPIDDVALYKQSQAYLVLKDLSTNVEEEILLTAVDQSFTGSYTLEKEGSFEAKVRIEDTSFTRESEVQTLEVSKAVKPSTTPGPVPPTEEDTKGPLGYILLGGGLLIVLIGGIVIFKQVKKAQTPLVGQVIIEVRDNTTGKLNSPQYKKLHLFKGKVSLHALMQFAPEFKGVEHIVFKSAPGDKVVVYNTSDYVIEKAGRAVQAGSGLELRKNDKFSINVVDSGQTIQIEYLL